MNTPPPPLILTLGLDRESFEQLDALRRAHFPPARNQLPAHLTLFHQLPGQDPSRVALAIRPFLRPVALRFTVPRSLGRGVAIDVTSAALIKLRADLAQLFAGDLSPQDRQGFRPHVTIQNKVMPEAARALLIRLSDRFEPWDGNGTALVLWRYLGGPWEKLTCMALEAT